MMPAAAASFVKVDPDALVLLGEIGAQTSLRYFYTSPAAMLCVC